MSFLKIKSQSFHVLFNRMLNLTRQEISITSSRFISNKTDEPSIEDLKTEKLALEVIKLKKEIKLNGYIRFLQDCFKNDSILNKSQKFTEYAKKWQTIDPVEKLKYKQEATKVKTKNLSRIDELYKNLSIEEKVKIEMMIENLLIKKKEPISEKNKKILIGKPKRPMNSWTLFLQDQDRGDAGLEDFIAGSSLKWKQLTVQEKESALDTNHDFNTKTKQGLFEEYKKIFTKKIVCPYDMFVKEQYQSLEKSLGHKIPLVPHIIAEKWATQKFEDRLVYFEIYDKEVEEYSKIKEDFLSKLSMEEKRVFKAKLVEIYRQRRKILAKIRLKRLFRKKRI